MKNFTNPQELALHQTRITFGWVSSLAFELSAGTEC